MKENGERSLQLDRLIPMSQIKRIWDNGDNFFGIAQETYKDLYVEKANPNETILEFYKRSYVPIPLQIVIDSNT
jgi:hypothetical protein